MELLVAMTFFAIVITAFLGLFVSAFREQKKNIAAAKLLNAASYATEYMGRALRMAATDDGDCITADYNYRNTGGAIDTVRFLNHYEECQEFFLYIDAVAGDRTLRVRRSSDDNSLNWIVPSGEDVTPRELLVENLRFELDGEKADESPNPNEQPRVTIVLRLATKGDDPQRLEFQTTISQRELDVP